MSALQWQLDAALFAAVSDEDRLFQASAQGRAPDVVDLLDRGANVHARNARLETALHKAAGAGNGHCCLILVQRGAEVDAVDLEGERPLHHAARRDQTLTCLTLVAAGAAVKGLALTARNTETQRVLRLPRLRAAAEFGDADLMLLALEADENPLTLGDRARKAIAHAEARGKVTGPRILRAHMAALSANLAMADIHISQSSRVLLP